MAIFRRKPNRLPASSYVGRQSYFLTLCSGGRRKVFTDSRFVGALLDLIRSNCSAHCFGVYASCFMPDHLHLVLRGEESFSNLTSLVRAFKGTAAAEARAFGVRCLWQKGFYDHVVRSEKELKGVAWYVFTNPVRAGLVREPNEWPFSGSWMFDWEKLSAPAVPFVPPWKKPMAG